MAMQEGQFQTDYDRWYDATTSYRIDSMSYDATYYEPYFVVHRGHATFPKFDEDFRG